MPVDLILDSLDSVEESEKPFFEKNDAGKFAFSWDKFTESARSLVNKKNRELLAEKNAMKAAVARFESFKDLADDDLTEISAWLEAGKPKGGSKPEEIEALKGQIAKTFEKQLAKAGAEKSELAKQLEGLSKEVRHFKLTVPVRDAALKAGVIPDDIDLVLMDTASNFGLNDDGKVVVLDADGDPSETSLKDFFEKLYKQKRPKFYAASNAGGSGAGHGTGGGAGAKTITRERFEAMSQAERMAASKAGVQIQD